MSWGMPVMATRPASASPMTAPRHSARAMRTAVTIMPCPGPVARVRPATAATATAMPNAPAILPATAVSCRDSPAAARMNRMAAAT